MTTSSTAISSTCAQPHHHVPAGALLPGGLLAVAFGLGFFKLVPHRSDGARLFGRADPRGLLGDQPAVRASVARAGQREVGLHHGAHSGADPAARPRPPTCWGSAGWCWPRVVAIASKFVLAIGRKHIFNPVAIGVAAVAPCCWTSRRPGGWAAISPLLPFVLIGGLLVVRKVQRFDMVGAYRRSPIWPSPSRPPPPALLRRGADASRCSIRRCCSPASPC